MATYTNQSEAEVFISHDESVEALQEILVRDRLEPVTYKQAQELGYELMVFFEAFGAPGQEEEDDGSSPRII